MIFLSKYDEIDNIELKNIISSYQDYFLFKNKNNIIELYLDVSKLKYYLLNGLEIKYRDYIFLFLQKIKSSKKKDNYSLINNINNLDYTKNSNENSISFFTDIDYKNLNKILYLSKKIITQDNSFVVSNNNIIQLENNLYVDILLERFYFDKPKKQKDKFNFIIINYFNEIKNKILSLLAIDNYETKIIIDNNFNDIENNTQQLNTKCNLILLDKTNIKLWMLLIKNYAPNNKIIVIEKKKDLENIKNKDIICSNFVLLNYQILSNKFYLNYFKKYYSNNSNNSNNFNNLSLSITNSIYDNIKNLFLLEEKCYNFHLFNWNNIIYDEIENIFILNNKLISYLTTKNIKYYLQSNFINESTINDIIVDNFDNINNFYIDNFYNIIYDILLIKNEDKFIIDNIKKTYIEFELSDNHKKIYNMFFSGPGYLHPLNLPKSEQDYITGSESGHAENIINKENYKKMSLYFTGIFNQQFNFKTLDEMSKITDMHYEKLINNKNIAIQDTLLLQSKKNYANNIIQNFNNDINKYCSICIEKINNDNCCILTCGHYFCKNCIDEYINTNKSTHNIYNCPICRDNFTINNIYYPNLLDNNNDDNKTKTKLNYLLNICTKESANTNIIIITQFEEIINKIDIFFKNNNILYNNLLKKQKKNYNQVNNQVNDINNIYLCDYNYILKKNNFNINKRCKIILLDYPEITNINDNLFYLIKNIYFNKILSNSIECIEFSENSMDDCYGVFRKLKTKADPLTGQALQGSAEVKQEQANPNEIILSIHEKVLSISDEELDQGHSILEDKRNSHIKDLNGISSIAKSISVIDNEQYVEIYFLYYKNTIEEYIINKIYKEN